jgi:hypothetical protein
MSIGPSRREALMQYPELDVIGVRLLRWPPPRRHRNDQSSKPGRTVSSVATVLPVGARDVNIVRLGRPGPGGEPNA